MPYISRLNEQILDTFTCYTTDTTEFYPVNTYTGGNYYPYHQVREYTDVFYNDLKILLEEASTNGLDVICNESEKSFTLFGQKFYCFCIETSYSACDTYKNERYSIVPIIYKENYISNPMANIYEGGETSANSSEFSSNAASGNANKAEHGFTLSIEQIPKSDKYHTNTYYKNFNRHLHDYHLNYTTTNKISGYTSTTNGGYTTYGYGYYYDHVGFNLQASLCENYTLRNTIKYKINLYYNNNYIYITYGNWYDGYITEYPLGFFAKGIDYSDKEVLLTTLSPTILSNSILENISIASITMYSRISIWDIETGKNLYEQDEKYIDTFNINKYPYMNEYLGIDTSKFIKVGLQALNGLIKFDNLIVGEISKKYHTFTRGQYYTIDGEDYYIPVDIEINNLYPDKTTYNGIFLKM